MHEDTTNSKYQEIHKKLFSIPEIVGEIAGYVGEHSQWPRGKDDDLTKLRLVSKFFKQCADPIFYRRIADGMWNAICVGGVQMRDVKHFGDAAVKYLTESRYRPERIRGGVGKDSVETHLLRRCVEATFVEWGKQQLSLSGGHRQLRIKNFRFPGRLFAEVKGTDQGGTDQEMYDCLMKWGFSGNTRENITILSGAQGHGYEIRQGDGIWEVPNPYQKVTLPAEDPLFQSEFLRKMIVKDPDKTVTSAQQGAEEHQEREPISKYCTSLTIGVPSKTLYSIVPNYKEEAYKKGDKTRLSVDKDTDGEAYDLIQQRLQEKDLLYSVCADRIKNAMASPALTAGMRIIDDVEALKGKQPRDWLDFNTLQFPLPDGENCPKQDTWLKIKKLSGSVFQDQGDALRALMHISHSLTGTYFPKAMRTDNWSNNKGKGGLFKMKENIQAEIYDTMLNTLSTMQQKGHAELNGLAHVFQENGPELEAVDKIDEFRRKFRRQSLRHGSKIAMVRASDQPFADFLSQNAIHPSEDDYLTLRKNGANYDISLGEIRLPVPESSDRNSPYRACVRRFLQVGEGMEIVNQAEREIKMLQAEYLRSRCFSQRMETENNAMFKKLMHGTSQPLRKELEETIFKNLFSSKGTLKSLVNLIKSCSEKTDASPRREDMYRDLCSFINENMDALCSRKNTNPDEIVEKMRSLKKEEWEDPLPLFHTSLHAPQPMDIDSHGTHHPDRWKAEVGTSDTEFYDMLASRGISVSKDDPIDIYEKEGFDHEISQNGVTNQISYFEDGELVDACLKRVMGQGVGGRWEKDVSNKSYVHIPSVPDSTVQAFSR